MFCFVVKMRHFASFHFFSKKIALKFDESIDPTAAFKMHQVADVRSSLSGQMQHP